MAILQKLRAFPADPADPAEIEIPELRNDPDYAAASALLGALGNHRERLRLEREKTILQRLADAEDWGGNETVLRIRLAALQALPPLAPSAIPAPDAPSSAIVRALAAMAGKPIAEAPNFQTSIANIDRDSDALDEAIGEQHGILGAIADTLTAEYSERLRPACHALNLEMFRAAQQLARSTNRMRKFRARVSRAGIKDRSDILWTPNVRGPLVLGNEEEWDSEISGWRRLLEGRGVL
jgi:hypothetical protein